MGFAERVAVLHAHQVTDETPGESEPLRYLFQRFDQTGPTRLEIRFQLIEEDAQFGEEFANARHDVARVHEIEARQRIV